MYLFLYNKLLIVLHKSLDLFLSKTDFSNTTMVTSNHHLKQISSIFGLDYINPVCLSP